MNMRLALTVVYIIIMALVYYLGCIGVYLLKW